MKKILLFILALTVSVSCTKKGCTNPTALNYSESAKKDDGSCVFDEPTDNVIKSGYITSDETWTSDNIYQLNGKVIVSNGVTLTIESGTIIKGQQGTGTLASALIISKGGMIIANGTSTEPIIFTSVLDNIEQGQTEGTNINSNDNGLWGGLIILGDAPISAADGDVLTQIEGIPVTDSYGAFGGTNPNDNSGSLSYISIRHGGALIGAGNEINGLTLGGVGNGTYISNIEIISNLDDGVEFFGGTVNVSNIIVYGQGDDGIDIDMNYAGTVDNFMVINTSVSDEGLEVDGPEGSTHTNGLFILQNGTVLEEGNTPTVDFKSKAQGTINNVILGDLKLRASYQNDCVDDKGDAYLNLVIGDLTFNSVDINSVSVYTTSTDNSGNNNCTVDPNDQLNAETTIVYTPTVGADTSVFGWTWCNLNGKY